MMKQIAFILAAALLVSCSPAEQTVQQSQVQQSQAVLPVNAQQEPTQTPEFTLAPNPTETATEPEVASEPEAVVEQEELVPPLDHAVIQYGHPDLITDNDSGSALLTYIRYPQADGFADEVIAKWAQETHESARQTVELLREADPEATGEINIHFDSYLSPDGGFAGIIEQGVLMNTGLAHPEDVIKIFNLDLQSQMILDNPDVLDYSRMTDLLVLLREKLLESSPESVDYIQEINETWLNYLAIGSDGIIILLERGMCLPAYMGSVSVTLPYDELGDLLLLGGKQAPIPETPPDTAPPPETTDAPPAGDIDLSKPMIALTFDDGPSKYTPQILDLLEQYGGRATFCVIGNLVDAGKDTVIRATDMGCEIVGHSWDHRDLTKLSAEEIKSELANTNSVIDSVTGTPSQLFRPPYGAINDNLKSVSKDMGLWILFWSVDTLDWKTKNADAVYKAVMDGAADRAIILNHDLYGSTAEAMARIIPELVGQGYQLVTVSELMQYSGIDPEAGTVYRNGK